MDEKSLNRRSRTVLFSISSNALLLVVKLAAGVLTGSVSVLSEAVHSATDLVASIVAFAAVRARPRPRTNRTTTATDASRTWPASSKA